MLPLYILLLILAALFIAEIVARIGGVKKKPPEHVIPEAGLLPKENVRTERNQESRTEITPVRLVVTPFTVGKVDCQLVMRGPNGGVVKRLLLLWKVEKCRSIQMKALYGVRDDSLDEVHRTSLEEAKRITTAVYGKKKHAKAAPIVETTVPQPNALVLPPTVVEKQHEPVVLAPVDTVPETVQRERPNAPTIKGFIAQYIGKIVTAGIHKHATGGYDIFTVVLDTPEGPVNLAGVDLKRAMVAADVKEGDEVRAFHVMNKELAGGKIRKEFQMIKLTERLG